MHFQFLKMTILEVVLLFTCMSVGFCESVKSAPDVPKYCGKGPVAWCRNFSTSIECNATRHCWETVWLTHKPTTTGSCGSCETQILKIRQTFASVSRFALTKNICNSTLKSQFLRLRCQSSLDQYTTNHLQEWLDFLKSDIHPTTVCQVIGVCSGIKSNNSISSINNGVVVTFGNILLHLPAAFTDVAEFAKPLSVQRCSWGSWYWCQNLTSSKECTSTSHCIQNIWSKLQYNKDDDSVCQVCQRDMVQQARYHLLRNKTWKELRSLFKGSCKFFPIEEVRSECLKLVDGFLFELTEMLASEMKPTAICTVAGLCNNPRIDSLLKATDLCINCTAVVTATHRFIRGTPEYLVQYKLLQLCHQLTSDSESCVALFVSNFQHLYQMLLTKLHPLDACHASGICAQQYYQPSSRYSSTLEARVNTLLDVTNNSIRCNLCEQLVKHLKDILMTNTTPDKFLSILKGVCQRANSFQNGCLEIVDKNFQKMYEYLTKELNPEGVCRGMNFCIEEDSISDENMNLIFRQVPPAASDTQQDISSTKWAVEYSDCRFWKTVTKVIQKEEVKPGYEYRLKRRLIKVCPLVPHSNQNYQKECDYFIRRNVDSLIRMLTNPKELDFIIRSSCSDPLPNRDNSLCFVCQYLLHFLQVELEKPEEQQKIEKAMNRTCKLVPASMRTECQTFVIQYGALLINLFSHEIDPSLVCPAMRFCPRQISLVDRCVQCQTLVEDVMAKLGNNRTEEKLVQVLSSLVFAKRSNLTSTAVELMVNHQEDLVDMMNSQCGPTEKCVLLRFCDSKIVSSGIGER